MIIEELLSVLKGLYPPFLWLTILGIISKIYRKEWKSFDTLCAVIALVFLAGIVFLPYIFYGKFSVSRRYVLVIFPFLLFWTVYGLDFCRNFVKRFHIPGIIWKLAFAALAVVLFIDAYTPVTKKFTSKRKRFERQTILQASEFIRKDYKGPSRTDTILQICDQYAPNRRPQVSSSHPETGYLSGGQNHDPRSGRADYLVTWDNARYKLHYTKAHSFVVNGKTVMIWRKNGL